MADGTFLDGGWRLVVGCGSPQTHSSHIYSPWSRPPAPPLQVSIVDFLASEGWDVWCVCLRGNGASDKKTKLDISAWTIGAR
jgi:hypothetical protein